MKNKKLSFFILVVTLLTVLAFIIKLNANIEDVILIESEFADITLEENRIDGPSRELVVKLNNIKGGKRVTDVKYCLYELDCSSEENWVSSYEYDNTGMRISEFHRGTGDDEKSFWIKVPSEKLNLRVDFTNFEPMAISYSKYTKTNVYSGDVLNNLNNYENEFTSVAEGYIGGDIILPVGCLENGCVLKFTLTNEDYNAYKERLDYYNENENLDMEQLRFADVGTNNNHLPDELWIPADTANLLLTNNEELYIENGEGTKSFYVIINKYFYVNNRTDFEVAGNKNRILSEDYIGLKYKNEKKYFPEGNDYGFLTFTDYNEYRNSVTLFYGTPRLQLQLDRQDPVLLADGGNADGMGTLKYNYNKIVSQDNDKFPVDNNFRLTINSFYEQDYNVPLTLKNNDEKVKDITLNLSRFAFGGNAGGLLLVDGNGINCKQPWNNPDCSDNNTYISTDYRGIIDTFYSNGETDTINAFEIERDHNNDLVGRALNNELVYRRNEDFNPWAVAIFYKGDEVIMTKSFELGSRVTFTGFTEEAINEEEINGIANNGFGEGKITDYNHENYTYFGYGRGYEKPINTIKYFNRNAYEDGNFSYTLILASKKEILDNGINKISLFLTNGDLKPDENVFPELKYGVGEGKIFELDGRTFDMEGGF